MFKKLNIPIMGIVQNMSVMKCSKCSHENHVFGDSVHQLAEQEGILLLTPYGHPFNGHIKYYLQK